MLDHPLVTQPAREDETSIFEYVRSMLGAPIIKVEVTDDMLSTFLKQALTRFSRLSPCLHWFSMPAFANVQEYRPPRDTLGYGVVNVVIPRLDPIAPMLMCLDGDTKVSLLDGRSRTINQLQEEYGAGEFWVYSCGEDGTVHPGKAHSIHKSGSNAKVLEVEISNGRTVRCTPEHRFLLRDGSYREAKDLLPGDSLMPLYRKKSVKKKNNIAGYDMFLSPKTGKWKFTHRCVANELLEKPEQVDTSLDNRLVVHHEDCNKLNNSPDNLVWMVGLEHRRWHNKNWERTLSNYIGTPEAAANLKKAQARSLEMWKEDPERRKEISGRIGETVSQRWADGTYDRERVLSSLQEGAKKNWEENYEYMVEMAKKNITKVNDLVYASMVTEITDLIEGEINESSYKVARAKYIAATGLNCRGSRVPTWKTGRKYIGLGIRGYNSKSDVTNTLDTEKFKKNVSAAMTKTWSDNYVYMSNQAVKASKAAAEKKVKDILSYVDGDVNEASFNTAREKYVAKIGRRRSILTWNTAKKYLDSALSEANHNVVAIRDGGYCDVYDFSVDTYHNFGLDAGIFVHNSSGPRMDIFGYRYSYPYRSISELYFDFFYFKEASRILSADFRWQYLDGAIRISPKPDDAFTLTYVSAFPYSVETFPADDIDWLKDYVLAMAKIAMGHVRRKLQIPTADGLLQHMDGQELVSEGMAMKQELDAKLMERARHFPILRT